MPHRRAPVVLADLSRRRRMHREHAAEADPERAEPRQTNGPHREVAVTAVHFESNGRRWLVTISYRQLLEAFVEQLEQVRRQQRRLAPMDDQMKAIRLRLTVLAEGVEQIECVLDPDVVRIARERAVEVHARRVELANAQRVHSESAPCE